LVSNAAGQGFSARATGGTGWGRVWVRTLVMTLTTVTNPNGHTPRAPQDFWSLIHHSYALVPAFGMPVYYESRISSTILASLLTCVPVIAEQRLLDTYTFLE
jgi:hypothetical protein